tara:strand:+ start:46 stop:501 length:456 start_codon:yes stop_codon:yes gene_type:complete
MTPDEFSSLLRGAHKTLKTEAAATLLAHGMEIVGNAMENFTGDDLPRIKKGKYAGEPRFIKTANSGYLVGPRSINGYLRSSLDSRLEVKDDEIIAHITAGKKHPVVYAAALEYGYPARNLQPRMYIGRAFLKQKPEIEPSLNDLLRTALNA